MARQETNTVNKGERKMKDSISIKFNGKEIKIKANTKYVEIANLLLDAKESQKTVMIVHNDLWETSMWSDEVFEYLFKQDIAL